MATKQTTQVSVTELTEVLQEIIEGSTYEVRALTFDYVIRAGKPVAKHIRDSVAELKAKGTDPKAIAKNPLKEGSNRAKTNLRELATYELALADQISVDKGLTLEDAKTLVNKLRVANFNACSLWDQDGQTPDKKEEEEQDLGLGMFI